MPRKITAYLQKRQRWTQQKLKLLCQLWWIHGHHVGGMTAVVHLFRQECHEKGITCNESDKALQARMDTLYSLYLRRPTHCSPLLRRVFEEVRHELDKQ